MHLVDDVHASDDAAEHGIARAAWPWSSDVLSTRLTKNCEVALFGSLVRAIDSEHGGS
jgi:hypothetical protein